MNVRDITKIREQTETDEEIVTRISTEALKSYPNATGDVLKAVCLMADNYKRYGSERIEFTRLLSTQAQVISSLTHGILSRIEP